MAKEFDWVDFYKEFAGKLLEYKNKRNDLIEKVKKIRTYFISFYHNNIDVIIYILFNV